MLLAGYVVVIRMAPASRKVPERVVYAAEVKAAPQAADQKLSKLPFFGLGAAQAADPADSARGAADPAAASPSPAASSAAAPALPAAQLPDRSSTNPQGQIYYDRRTPLVRAIEKCAPAVVNIYTRQETVERDPMFFGIPDVYLRNLPREAIERKRVSRSLGSGVLVHEDGYIVTNAHVIQQASQIKVVLSDKREFDATLVSADQDNDLAIVKISGDKSFPAAELGTSSDLLIGETVIAIGNPLGYSNTASAGIISAVNRDLDLDKEASYKGLIQTDTAINPGNSGGALVNINGEVIGINVAIRADAEGLGFAIPVDRLRENLGKLLNFRNLRKIWLGAALAEDRRKLPSGAWRSSVRLTELEPNSPAVKADLRAGDVVIEAGDRPVHTLVDFETALLRYKVGDLVPMKVTRDGKEHNVSVKLAEAPVPDDVRLARDRLGLHLMPLNAELRKKFRLAVDFGLMVTGVEEKSPAAEVGFEAGDVIIQAGTHRLGDAGELGLVLGSTDEGGKVVLRVVRGRYVVRAAVAVRGKPEIRH